MKRSFVETKWFTEDIGGYLTEEEFSAFQRVLLENPRKGVVVARCGGLRKVRYSHPARRKGKRGGVRVYYLDVPTMDRIYLIDIHDKDEKENLTPDERKVLKRIVQEIKRASRIETKRKGIA